MRKFSIVFLVVLACVTAYNVEPTREEDWKGLMQDETAETRAILNSQVQNAVHALFEQMPCGWPEYQIPPLAPFTNSAMKFHLAKSVLDSTLELFNFRVDGLDKVDIKDLKVSYLLNKMVKFHFNFKEIKATASTLNTNLAIDLMKQLGVSVHYEGKCPLEFTLENLSIRGQFKYTMPFFFGSINIYKFEAIVTLGSVRSKIGILSNDILNNLLNEEIEKMAPILINRHQSMISAMIEENVVPRINAKLKGKKIWSLFFGGSSGKCKPTPAPSVEQLPAV